MKIRHPAAIRFVSTIASYLIRVWLATTRVRLSSDDGRTHPTAPSDERFLYLFWHENLLAVCTQRTPVQVLISRHADGELIAQVCQRLGFGVVRGSSSVGGERAMFEMIREADTASHLAITPDGPRGPRRKLKVGPVLVALHAKLSIVPVGVGFASAWRAGSWDRFAVPRPFSTIAGVFGEPIVVPGELDRKSIETYVQLVQERMDAVSARAEKWAEALVGDSAAPVPPAAEPGALRRAA